jgi:uncharacterized protein YjbI with pentapeptide repeats
MPQELSLRADCGRCFGLCCVALPFARSSDFAIDKEAGIPCPHLGSDHRCTIHAQLRTAGFAGCTSYDCFGAGQRIAQETFRGLDWRTHRELAAPMMAAFRVMQRLHELLWYLRQASTWDATVPLRPRIEAEARRVDQAAGLPAERLRAVDAAELRAQIAPLLREASALARAGLDGSDHSDADLTGADLRGFDLVGSDLRNAHLLGADLRGNDLRLTDLLGADLRGADVRGAALGEALFLTQMQLDTALGDGATTIPEDLTRPSHWPADDAQLRDHGGRSRGASDGESRPHDRR